MPEQFAVSYARCVTKTAAVDQQRPRSRPFDGLHLNKTGSRERGPRFRRRPTGTSAARSAAEAAAEPGHRQSLARAARRRRHRRAGTARFRRSERRPALVWPSTRFQLYLTAPAEWVSVRHERAAPRRRRALHGEARLCLHPVPLPIRKVIEVTSDMARDVMSQQAAEAAPARAKDAVPPLAPASPRAHMIERSTESSMASSSAAPPAEREHRISARSALAAGGV